MLGACGTAAGFGFAAGAGAAIVGQGHAANAARPRPAAAMTAMAVRAVGRLRVRPVGDRRIVRVTVQEEPRADLR